MTAEVTMKRAMLVLLLMIAPASGAATESEESPPSKWHFEAQPYAWLPDIPATVTVKGRTVHANVTASDVWDLLTGGNAFAAAGYFSLSYDRFSVFDDSFGGYLEASVSERIPTPLCCSLSIRATDKIKLVINDAALGYELGRWSLPGRKRSFTLGVYAGARTMWFSNKLTANAGVVGGVQKAANVSDSFAWSDPLIGVRWSAPLLDWLSLDFRGDIGGFGASSHLIWGISSAAKVWLPWHPLSLQPYAFLGYRLVDFDRSSNTGNISMQVRGATAGAGFVF
jgi:hypothetical protein